MSSRSSASKREGRRHDHDGLSKCVDGSSLGTISGVGNSGVGTSGVGAGGVCIGNGIGTGSVGTSGVGIGQGVSESVVEGDIGAGDGNEIVGGELRDAGDPVDARLRRADFSENRISGVGGISGGILRSPSRQFTGCNGLGAHANTAINITNKLGLTPLTMAAYLAK